MESTSATKANRSHDEVVRQHDGHENCGDHDTTGPIELASDLTKTKKTKTRNRSMAGRGPTALHKFRGTGFEGIACRRMSTDTVGRADESLEYYADPPMTPQEAEEEKYDIYSPSLPFEERIQSCIQRFKGRRRMNNDLMAYFNEYLFFGGIDTSPNAYVGTDPGELKDLTPAERREATATTTVRTAGQVTSKFYNGDGAHWTVDFTGVAAGYLSSNTLLTQTQLNEGKLSEAVCVVEHFLRYCLQHRVCPEFTKDIQQAMELCQTARAEYPLWIRLQAALPGQFNLAAHAIFRDGGSRDRNGYEVWKTDLQSGMDPDVVFYSAIALMDNHDIFAKFLDQTPAVVAEYSCMVQAKQVHRPDAQITERFESLTLDGTQAKVPAIGHVVCTVIGRLEDEWDYADTESALPLGSDTTLCFDDKVLQNMVPGMKMELRLCELDIGLRYVKEVINCAPSFYTFLPQELMRGFREPVENDRPAPSVDNPEAEEGDMVRA